MTDVLVLPIIDRDDYEPFRAFLDRDLPPTYDEWLKLHRKEILEHRQRGGIVREIEVNSGEFAAHTGPGEHRRDLKGLHDYVIAKAARDR